MKGILETTTTIGGHNIRKLKQESDSKITGEVCHKHDSQNNWEKACWNRCSILLTYYSSQLGEQWDIDIDL